MKKYFTGFFVAVMVIAASIAFAHDSVYALALAVSANPIGHGLLMLGFVVLLTIGFGISVACIASMCFGFRAFDIPTELKEAAGGMIGVVIACVGVVLLLATKAHALNAEIFSLMAAIPLYLMAAIGLVQVLVTFEAEQQTVPAG